MTIQIILSIYIKITNPLLPFCLMIKSIRSSNKKPVQVTSITLTMSVLSSIDGSFDQIYDHYEQIKHNKFRRYQDKPKEIMTIKSIQCTRQKQPFQIKIKKDFPTVKYKDNEKLLAQCSMEVPYILSQLALEVKYCLEKAVQITFSQLNEVVLYKYSKKMDRFNINSKNALDKIKRRISEVLRVFQGANIVIISNKCIRITTFGKTNEIYVKQFKSKKQKLKRLYQQKNDLQDQKDKLLKIVSFIKYLKNRNKNQIQSKVHFNHKSTLKSNAQNIFLPIKITLSHETKNDHNNQDKNLVNRIIDNQQAILILSQSIHNRKW